MSAAELIKSKSSKTEKKTDKKKSKTSDSSKAKFSSIKLGSGKLKNVLSVFKTKKSDSTATTTASEIDKPIKAALTTIASLYDE